MTLHLTGQRFGRLVVVADTGLRKKRNSLFLCKCDCGRLHVCKGCKLKAGDTKSCGCLRSERTSARNHKIHTKHGHTSLRVAKRSRTYSTWLNMRYRCSIPTFPHYKYYGGRGITVCDRWLESFENFLEDMGERPENRTIDRVNPDKGYFKSNCRWATPKEQAQTRRKRCDGQRNS